MAHAVRFRLTEDDMVRAARLYTLVSLRRPKTIISLAITFLLCLLLMAWLGGVIFPLNMDRLAQEWPTVLGAGVFPFVLVFAVILIGNPMLARRTFRQQRSLHGEVGLTWTAERLEFDSEYGQFAMPWSHFTRFGEDKHTFVLFESDRLYRIIPKRVLDADTDRDLRERLATIGA
jgi:hypothetical protein